MKGFDAGQRLFGLAGLGADQNIAPMVVFLKLNDKGANGDVQGVEMKIFEYPHDFSWSIPKGKRLTNRVFIANAPGSGLVDEVIRGIGAEGG